MMTRSLLAALLCPLLVACSSEGSSHGSSSTSTSTGTGGSGGASLVPLPPLDTADLVTAETLKVVHAVSTSFDLDPRDVGEMKTLLADGWGEIAAGPAETVVARTLDGSPAPAPGTSPKLLTRFLHFSDAHIVDDESPDRLENEDAPGVLAGAFRPHEGHECLLVNDAVRTVNAFAKKSPLDFVMVGGDSVDNAQSNELDWFLGILDGAPSVECDSGDDDDPVPGPSNDPKDPFVPEGLSVPWYWATGNHDVLAMGIFPVADKADTAIGGYSPLGARDWSQPGAPVVTGEVPADPRRKVLTRADLLAKVAASGGGHGVGSEVVAYGKAFYTFDVPGGAVRFVVLDTAAETGGSDGVIHQADVDKFIKPALDKAKADGKLVILTSHHDSATIGDGSDFGGVKQDDAIASADWQTLVGGYDNVLMHLAAHNHTHVVRPVAPAGGHPYWEMETASLTDQPRQMRVIEVWDQGGGLVSIKAIPLDYSTKDDTVGKDGLTRAVCDYTSGWGQDGTGEVDARSVELWIAK